MTSVKVIIRFYFGLVFFSTEKEFMVWKWHFEAVPSHVNHVWNFSVWSLQSTKAQLLCKSIYVASWKASGKVFFNSLFFTFLDHTRVGLEWITEEQSFSWRSMNTFESRCPLFLASVGGVWLLWGANFSWLQVWVDSVHTGCFALCVLWQCCCCFNWENIYCLCCEVSVVGSAHGRAQWFWLQDLVRTKWHLYVVSVEVSQAACDSSFVGY